MFPSQEDQLASIPSVEDHDASKAMLAASDPKLKITLLARRMIPLIGMFLRGNSRLDLVARWTKREAERTRRKQGWHEDEEAEVFVIMILAMPWSTLTCC